jgi:hypothetical protein
MAIFILLGTTGYMVSEGEEPCRWILRLPPPNAEGGFFIILVLQVQQQSVEGHMMQFTEKMDLYIIPHWEQQFRNREKTTKVIVVILFKG